MRFGGSSVRLFADGVCVFRNAARRWTAATVQRLFFLSEQYTALTSFCFRSAMHHTRSCPAFSARRISLPWYARPLGYSVVAILPRRVSSLVMGIYFSRCRGNYVRDCSRFAVGPPAGTVFYPGTLRICQLLPLLTSPAFRNRIQTCRISACLYSTSVFLSCQYFRSQNMQNIRTF